MWVLICLSCRCKLQQKTWAITLLECTTISLREIPHFFTIYNSCFLRNLGDINRTIYRSPLLTHRETFCSAASICPSHGVSSRKKQQEKARLWSIPCAMPAQTLPATLPMARGKASTGNNPTALTLGQNQLSTFRNTAPPFQSHIKHVLSLQTPGSYSPCFRSLFPLTNICIMLANTQLQSTPVLSMLARKGSDSTPQAQSPGFQSFMSE